MVFRWNAWSRCSERRLFFPYLIKVTLLQHLILLFHDSRTNKTWRRPSHYTKKYCHKMDQRTKLTHSSYIRKKVFFRCNGSRHPVCKPQSIDFVSNIFDFFLNRFRFLLECLDEVFRFFKGNIQCYSPVSIQWFRLFLQRIMFRVWYWRAGTLNVSNQILL
jgi:hypothetical protein